MQADLVGIAALDVQVANAQAHMHKASSGKLARVAARLLIIPVFGRSQRNQR